MSMKDFVKTLNEEQRKALLEALSGDSSTPTQSAKKTKDEKKPTINNEDFTMNAPSNNIQKKRREPVKARENIWTDTGESKDVVTPDINPTPRTRKLPSKVKLQCHVCGKDFEVDKRFVFGEYNRCDRCASKK